jgi:predicted dehydrogenase
MGEYESLDDRRTGVAILGCGYWGMNYVRVFAELADARVLVVCDERQVRLDEAARRFPGVSMTTDVREALATPGVEAAIVCTEARKHHELASLALGRGKHVLVEKPLTTNVGDANELVALAENQGLLLLVGHTFVYNPGVRKVKEYLAASELGDVYYLYSRRTNLGPIRSDVDAIWDLAPHDIAIFNFLLEAEPEWVSAVAAKVLGNAQEDVGFISLGYPNSIVGHIHVSWAEPNKVREVVVVGSDKRIVFNDLDALERVRVFNKGVKSVRNEEPTSFGEYHLLLRDGDINSPSVAVTEPLKQQCGHFLHCIRRGEAPLTDGRRGREVVQVMEAIERSIELSGAPVPIARNGEVDFDPKQLASLGR